VDGYVGDETGAFDWIVSDQVHEFITELVRPMGAYLYGRRLYETMVCWDAPGDGYPPNSATAHKSGRRPRRSSFHERLQPLRHATGVSSGIGARHQHWRRGACGFALEADLVDEYHLFLNPVIVGGGKWAFRAGLRQRNLELL